MTQSAGAVHEATVHVRHSQFQLNDYGVIPELEAEIDGMLVPISGGC